MSPTVIRKKSGEIVEIDSEEPLTLAEIKEAIGEPDRDPLLEQLVALVAELKSQGAAKPPVVNVSPEITVSPAPVSVPPPTINVEAPSSSGTPPKEWRSATISITAWDNQGRIKTMTVEKLY